jgi:hypothetical protein
VIIDHALLSEAVENTNLFCHWEAFPNKDLVDCCFYCPCRTLSRAPGREIFL